MHDARLLRCGGVHEDIPSAALSDETGSGLVFLGYSNNIAEATPARRR